MKLLFVVCFLTCGAFVYGSINESPEPQQYDYGKELLNMFLNLGLLLLLVIVAAWFFRRFIKSRARNANNSSLIKIVEKRMLTQKSSLYLIEVAGKTLVIAESVAGLQFLAEVDENKVIRATQESQSIPSPLKTFKDILKFKKLEPTK